MATISRLPFLIGFDKNEKNYLTYKYQDIKPEWIIHQGTLDYFQGENFLFKHSICKLSINKFYDRYLTFVNIFS